MKQKIKLKPLSLFSSYILKIGLPIISTVFLYIMYFLLDTPNNERAYTVYTVYSMIEYATMSFTLIFCGALVTDLAIKSI